MLRFGRFALVAVVASTGACNAERLTGADAQRAVAEGQSKLQVVPDSIAVFIDDVRQPAGKPLAVRHEDVLRVEVVKGHAARARLGPDAAGGAIYIYTKRAR